MATVTVRYEGTVEIECSNRAAKKWENDGETTDTVQKKLDKFRNELIGAIANVNATMDGEPEVEIEEANTDD